MTFHVKQPARPSDVARMRAHAERNEPPVPSEEPLGDDALEEVA